MELEVVCLFFYVELLLFCSGDILESTFKKKKIKTRKKL